MDKPESIYIPTLEYNSLNGEWKAMITDQAGEILFISPLTTKPGEVKKALVEFANDQIREWERFKLVLDYIQKVLQGPKGK